MFEGLRIQGSGVCGFRTWVCRGVDDLGLGVEDLGVGEEVEDSGFRGFGELRI